MDEAHTVIRKEPADCVLRYVSDLQTCSDLHLLAALKRRHSKIFDAVLLKCNTFPFVLPMYLLLAPPMYLEKCLEAGLNVNDYNRKGESILEIAVRKHKVKHVGLLLKHPPTKLTQKASTGILKDKVMKQYIGLLFERGLPADPSYVTKALKENNTMLLQGALTSLQWEEVIEYLKCPILNSPTADLVQTPQGQLYDKQSILQWIHAHHTDPLTRAPLYEADLRTRADILPDVLQHIKEITS